MKIKEVQKMTMTIKSHKNDNHYISMEWDKNNIYVVQVCPIIDENLCGYPIRKMTYAINEKAKAQNTFNRYVKKYT